MLFLYVLAVNFFKRFFSLTNVFLFTSPFQRNKKVQRHKKQIRQTHLKYFFSQTT